MSEPTTATGRRLLAHVAHPISETPPWDEVIPAIEVEARADALAEVAAAVEAIPAECHHFDEPPHTTEVIERVAVLRLLREKAS